MSTTSAAIALVATMLAPVDVPAEPDATSTAPATAPSVSATTTMLVWVDAAAETDDWRTRAQRVQAELEALGVHTVIFVPAPGHGSAPDVAREMEANDATIAVWIAADRDRAELWRREGQRLDNVAIVTGEGSEDDGTFAVRCAEVAHALATEVAPAPPVPARPVPRPPTPAPPPPIPRGDVRVGIMLGGASRDLGIVLGPVLGGGVRLGRQRRLGLDAELTGTAVQGRVRGAAGLARVAWLAARVHVGIWPIPRARVSPFLGIGGGLLAAWTHGRGEGAFEGRRDATVTAYGSALVDVAIRLSSRVRLRPGARIGVALPPLSVDTGGAAHRTALPIAELTVALDVLLGVR